MVPSHAVPSRKINPSHLSSMRACQLADRITPEAFHGHRAFGLRRRRAGRPQRSEDRTGSAISGGGRRPHLTRGRKVLTNCQRVLTACGHATSGLAGQSTTRVGVSLAAQASPYPVGQGSASPTV
jgi:hypothetical protein